MPAPSRTSQAPRTLASLEAGEEARVAAVDVATPLGRRLLDLGFVPGTPVRMVRRAPLGDPTSFALRGTRIALRRREALQVQVTAAAPAPDEPPA